jgi:hypothetical protein
MTENQPTTDRARRLEAVRSGQRETAIDRQDSGVNPRGNSPETTSRQRQNRMASDIADEIDVSREGVGTVDRLEGIDVFLRSSGTDQFSENVTDEFAGEADFVTPSDVDPNIDPEAISADPQVARGRRDDVAARARQQTAADDPFAQPSDFGAEVGAFGVESIGLTDMGARRRAGRQFESQTPLQQVDPTADIEPTDGGFALDSEAQRRSAARGFEADLELFGTGDLDPASDLRDIDGGFGLAREPAKQVAAERLDEQLPSVDVSPSDVELRQTDSGQFEGVFEQEVNR